MEINLVQMGAPQAGSAVPETGLPIASRAVNAQNTQSRQQPQQQIAVSEKTDNGFNPELTDEVRRENLRQAAEMIVRDVFVVTDMKFTIYKDMSGQFITRFTSLRDGAVTYFPEQDMNLYIESRGARRKALLQLDV